LQQRRLTHVLAENEPATNDWQRHETIEDALAVPSRREIANLLQRTKTKIQTSDTETVSRRAKFQIRKP
jgi:hypothetical protein